jgi:dTDP-4-dehydrorhamnose reductase
MADSSFLNFRTLLLGSNGMIGSALAKRFGDAPLTAFSHRELDITDYGALEKVFLRTKPQVVLNAAAFTRVDDCEKFRETAFLVNSQAPGHLAELCKKYQAFLIHFSTDYIFDGTYARPYPEDHAANPINYYGTTKWEGDKKIMSSGASFLILRTCWIFGKNGDNFIKKILKRGMAGAKLEVPADQIGSPTYADDVANAVSRLLSIDATGVYNFTNQGNCSRYEQTLTILKLYGLNNFVEAVKNDDLRLPAKRPSFSALDLTRYMEKTGHTPRSWQQSTAEYIDFLKQNEHELRS